jgi:hypothetical protein
MIEGDVDRVETTTRSGRRESASGRGGAVSGMAGRKQRTRTSVDRRAARAWERFAAGEDVESGIRSEILSSWIRCRDEFGVDPTREQAPATEDGSALAPIESIVAAELGAAAVSISDRVGAEGGVVSIADGRGRVLGRWGSGQAARRSSQQNLEPLAAWDESSTGTTGLGVALVARGPVAVNGYEHWCAAFHDWSCAAIAVRHPADGAAVGVIGISLWGGPLPQTAFGWLGGAARRVEERLRDVPHVGLPSAEMPPARLQRAVEPVSDRLVGLRGQRFLVVPVERVRAVVVEGGLVWLETAEGRLRASARGLDELEEKLASQGFLRVSRQALVNLRQVREIEPGFGGGVWLALEGGGELIAVARRRTPVLRRALGL